MVAELPVLPFPGSSCIRIKPYTYKTKQTLTPWWVESVVLPSRSTTSTHVLSPSLTDPRGGFRVTQDHLLLHGGGFSLFVFDRSCTDPTYHGGGFRPPIKGHARFRSTPVAPPEPVASRARLRHAVPYPYDTYSGRGPGRHSAIVVYVHPAVRIACF